MQNSKLWQNGGCPAIRRMLHRYRPTYGVFPIAERIGMGKASEYRGKVEALRGG